MTRSLPAHLSSCSLARAGEESRLEGLQAGADDYIVKPFTARELMARVEVHLKLAKLRRETTEREERRPMEAELLTPETERKSGIATRDNSPLWRTPGARSRDPDAQGSTLSGKPGFAGRSRSRIHVWGNCWFLEALKTVLSRVGKVAPTDSTALTTGETGTGKELIARAVHKRSERFGRAFVSVNCAALAPGLISSELFGHEKGAFTGAMQRHLGRFELADGGTIFLDEVGDFPLDTQVALLRVLQIWNSSESGEQRYIQVDVRVIAATHRDLRAAIRPEGSAKTSTIVSTYSPSNAAASRT